MMMEKVDALGIMVVYEKFIGTTETYLSLLRSAEHCNLGIKLLIYDNSAEPHPSPKDFGNEFIEVEYYHDPTNPGVSKAYNYGAKTSSHTWILLLDQDTIFPPEALQRYKDVIEKSMDYAIAAPILDSDDGVYSPFKLILGKGVKWPDVTPGIHPLRKISVLNSATLVNRQAYLAVGGYNEKIRLYFSDIDFIRNFSKKYDQIFVIPMTCFHELADVKHKKITTAVNRFHNYCEGGYYSVENNRYDFFLLSINMFLRAVKLSIQYRKLDFIKIFLKDFLFRRH